MKKSFRILLVTVILLPLLINVSFINYSRSDDPRIAKIVNKISSFTEKYTQQKVYLHTDKDVYMASETMWLKAYVLNASAMVPDTSSKDIYVELFNMSNQLVKCMTLRNYRGFSWGDISLSDSLMEGNYQLRAYTGWMKNFDPDFFFYKTISIKNPNYENVVTKTTLKEIKQFNIELKVKENENHVTFFPEGGSLIAGLPCNVAFKAENSLGNPLKIKGTIMDSKGSQVASFETTHDGMGLFKITPQSGNIYTAQVIYENGKTGNIQLPEVMPNGVTMAVDPSSTSNIKVLIQSNKPQTADASSNEIIIVGQSRGVVTYVSKGMVKDKILSVIQKKLFPSGVAQITLFDYHGEPICERLVFIAPQAETSSQLKLTSTSVDDSLFFNLKLAQANVNKVYGNFSLSVFENLTNHAISKENILTNLLLTSDLKGKINDPGYYFDEKNQDAAKHLDLVMLTNGWRRFVWKEIMEDKLKPIGKQDGIQMEDNTKTISGNASKFCPMFYTEQYDNDKISDNTQRDNFLKKKNKEKNKGVEVTEKYYYGSGSASITVGEDVRNYTSIIQYMRGRFPGVDVVGSDVIIRGVNTFNGSTQPLFLLDGVTVGLSTVESRNPQEIVRIDVFKGAEASIFGVAGGNGAIAFYSSRGHIDKKKGVEVTMVGYHKAREFYIPPYNSWAYKPENYQIPRTIFWSPYILTNAAGEATLRIKNKLGTEKYTVVVEGITSTGEAVYSKTEN